MRWIPRILLLLVVLMLAVFLHYSLPQRDIVRIVGTEIKRMDVGDQSWFWAEPDAGSERNVTRDVRFINAVFADRTAYSYRNEDTAWSWPPYFKFDSGTLTAKAQDLVSGADKPQWVIIRHYGWRSEWFSLFPNVLDIEAGTGPDQRLIPWFNIVVLGLLFSLIGWVSWRIIRFKTERVDPLIDHVEDQVNDVSETVDAQYDAARDQANGLWAGFMRWVNTWRSKDKRR